MSATRARPASTLNGCPCTGGTLDRLVQPAILVVLAEGPLGGGLFLLRDKYAQAYSPRALTMLSA
jgi:hypothetical protein